MVALEPQCYEKARPLLALVPFNTLFAQVVLDGDMPGSVQVDQPTDPGLMLVRHPYGMSLLCGKPGRNHFGAGLLRHLVRPTDVLAGEEWLQVYPGPGEEQPAVLDDLAGGPRVSASTRLNFAFHADRFVASRYPQVPEGMELVSTGGELFERMEGSVVPRAFWRDRDHFVRDGVGFSLLQEGQPVATAFSSFVKGRQLELGIETLPAYRGQGLASIVCARLLEHCLQHGLEPVWACRAENVGSSLLAGRLGFVPTWHLPYYHVAW